MKRALFALTGAIAGLIVLASCNIYVGISGNDRVVTQSYPAATGFTRVAMSGVGNVKLTQGATAAVAVQADENLLQYLTVEVVSGELRLGLKPFTTIFSYHTLEFDVTVPKLDSLVLSGAGGVETTAPFTGLAATVVDLSGVGSATLALDCTGPLTVGVSGSGSATVSGSAPVLTAELSGVGSMNAKALAAANANVTISGVGGAEVTASGTITYLLSGVGSLTYWGNPTYVTGSVSGIGSVKAGG